MRHLPLYLIIKHDPALNPGSPVWVQKEADGLYSAYTDHEQARRVAQARGAIVTNWYTFRDRYMTDQIPPLPKGMRIHCKIHGLVRVFRAELEAKDEDLAQLCRFGNSHCNQRRPFLTQRDCDKARIWEETAA